MSHPRSFLHFFLMKCKLKGIVSQKLFFKLKLTQNNSNVYQFGKFVLYMSHQRSIVHPRKSSLLKVVSYIKTNTRQLEKCQLCLYRFYVSHPRPFLHFFLMKCKLKGIVSQKLFFKLKLTQNNSNVYQFGKFILYMSHQRSIVHSFRFLNHKAQNKILNKTLFHQLKQTKFFKEKFMIAQIEKK